MIFAYFKGRLSAGRTIPFLACLLFVAAAIATAADEPEHGDFSIQGEYSGTISGSSGPKRLAVQVIALGNGEFRAVGYTGGLPGGGWNGIKGEEVTATAKGGRVTFKGKYAAGTIRDGVMHLGGKDGKSLGSLERIERKSPSLGKRPPPGGRVLFDGSSADAWVRSRNRGAAEMTADGLLKEGANSKQRFGDHQLHLEFLLPFEPRARGQGRGNSGCYVQGRYEVQMLDSFGLAGMDNECGGIYKISRPLLNMCYPPGSWQTYDIDFSAARYDDQGNKIQNARITVRHNGVPIHEDLELPQHTAAAPLKDGPEPGFIHLQDHGNPVRYRNIWVLEN
jgi:hypothetical protein